MLEQYAPIIPPKLKTSPLLFKTPKPGSLGLWDKRLIKIKPDIIKKSRLNSIFKKKDFIFIKLNIFKNCNTIRLRYFEENYEKNI